MQDFCFHVTLCKGTQENSYVLLCISKKNIKKKDINFSGVKNLCRDFSGHFIQISTDYVFDGKSGPYSEEDEPNPKSVYGKTKLFADNWLLDNYSKSTIIRTNISVSYTHLRAHETREDRVWRRRR